MRKLLVICSHLPPSSHVGAKRPAWFAKHLPEYGWQPFFISPSHQFFRIPRAIFRGLRIAWREHLDVVYSTSPNAETHVIGWWIRCFSRTLWVCEYRDPWTLQYAYRNPVKKIWHRFLERQWIRRADHVVTVGQVLKSHFQDRADVREKKISVIYNGYERLGIPERDPTRVSAEETRETWSVGYFGTFNPFSSPLPFLNALGALLRKRPDLRRVIRCDWIGYFKHAEDLRRECEKVCREHGLESIIHWHAEMPFEQGIASLRSADLLLLPVGGPSGPLELFRSRIPAKLFDYLALQKPILALAPLDGEAAQIVRAAGGEAVPYADEGAIADAIESAVGHRHQRWKPSSAQRSVMNRFDIRLQIKQLSIVLNKLAGYRIQKPIRIRLKQWALQGFFLAAGFMYLPLKIWRRRRLGRATIQSVLILASHSGMGNTVLLLPLIEAFKQKFPSIKITVLVRSGASAELLRHQTGIDDVIHLSVPAGLPFVRELPLLRRSFYKKKFDLAVSTFLEPYPENAIRALVSGAPYRISFNPGIYGALDTLTLAHDPGRHEIKNHELITDGLGIRRSTMPELTFSEDSFAGHYLEELGLTHKSLIGVHPGSDKATGSKRWPMENFLAVVETVRRALPDIQFLFFFGPEDESLHRGLASTDPPGVHAVFGRTVSQAASLIKRCRVFLSNDSGLMHLAAGLRVPVVAIFGPTIPSKNAPWGAGHVVIRESLPCSPCYDWRFFRESHDQLVFDPPCGGSVECLHSISKEQVSNQVLQQFMKESKGSSLEVLSGAAY